VRRQGLSAAFGRRRGCPTVLSVALLGAMVAGCSTDHSSAVAGNTKGVTAPAGGTLAISEAPPVSLNIAEVPGVTFVVVQDRPCEVAASIANTRLGFDKDSAALSPEGAATITKFIRALTKDGRKLQRVHITGHASAEGSVNHNQILSEQRASAVAAIIRIRTDASVTAEGLGSSKPVADNSIEPGREANRRVEALFTLTGCS
jgi:outer membrane protein OmpA-like peptidoglycan-associated protein